MVDQSFIFWATSWAVWEMASIFVQDALCDVLERNSTTNKSASAPPGNIQYFLRQIAESSTKCKAKNHEIYHDWSTTANFVRFDRFHILLSSSLVFKDKGLMHWLVLFWTNKPPQIARTQPSFHGVPTPTRLGLPVMFVKRPINPYEH